MSEFTIKEIANGWLLVGLVDADLPAAGEETIFAPNLPFLYDILVTWQTKGYTEALAKYREKMEEK